GCLWLVTVGIVVQLVPRLVEMGYSQPEAIGHLSAAALCALPGSLVWGYLDQRIGTRLASIAYGLVYILTLLILIFADQNKLLVLLAILLVGLCLGGIKSLITSMVGTAYGQAGFASAYRVIMPMSIIVRTLAFPIMGIAISMSGGLSAAYVAFILIDILAILLVLATDRPTDRPARTAEAADHRPLAESP
ncbi:MAG TPA: MFS transporter, partial [Sphingomonas sp.]|nr:MFS transporter [Sphingomonas sp.]